jgi:uncharacterized protein
MAMEFEWDLEKAAANLKKHGVAFDEAVEAFSDPNAVEILDDAKLDIEIRYRLIAHSSKRLLFVAYTYRTDQIIRVISARKATSIERKLYQDA